jgi:hypothetical protein
VTSSNLTAFSMEQRRDPRSSMERCASVIPANRASTYCGVPVRSSQSCNDAYGLRFFMMSEVFSESMNLSSGYFSLGEESLRRMNGGRILGRYGR